MKKIVLILIAVLTVSSCNLFHFSSSNKKVAKVGNNVLYENEVTKLLPPNVSPEDSVSMVSQYIENWALGHILLMKAEEKLSKGEKDVTAEVEDFKETLLGFRYKKLYVEERLDTVITTQESKKYYEEHLKNFSSDNSIIKARVIKINATSPYYEMIKSVYTTTNIDDIQEMEDLCYSSADKYIDFNKKWVSIIDLAKEIDIDVETCEKYFSDKSSLERESNGYKYLIFIVDKIAPHDISPYEYNRERIKNAIISKRKQDILSQLERDLLNDAINNNKLKIFKKND